MPEPCRHHAEGRCRHGDACRFSHAAQGQSAQAAGRPVCRQFLVGSCAHGDGCRFGHQVPECMTRGVARLRHELLPILRAQEARELAEFPGRDAYVALESEPDHTDVSPDGRYGIVHCEWVERGGESERYHRYGSAIRVYALCAEARLAANVAPIRDFRSGSMVSYDGSDSGARGGVHHARWVATAPCTLRTRGGKSRWEGTEEEPALPSDENDDVLP